MSTKLYRIVSNNDQVHYYEAETEQDAKEEHWDIHDPMGFDLPDWIIMDCKEATERDMKDDLDNNTTTIWFD